jgi:hypothetical protein
MAKGGGLNRADDYGSKKKPYPSVSKGDFAGGGRSYPIPTKADAVDALRLAGLHGRSDVKSKVYAKYPSLKKQKGGQPVMTQDSQKDPVHLQKTNNFVEWLHQAKEEAKVQQMMEEDMARIESGEYQIGGGVDRRSGYESGDYGQKKDINLGYFDAALSNMPGPMDSIMAIGHGLNAMGVFNKRKDKGQEQQPKDGDTTDQNSPIDAMPNTGFGSKQPDTFGRNTDQSFGQGNPMTLGDDFNKPVKSIYNYMAYGGDMPAFYAEDGIAVKGNTAHDTIAVPINKRNLSEYAQDVDYEKFPWLKGTPIYDPKDPSKLSHKDKWTRGAAKHMEGIRSEMKDARAKVHEAYGIDQATWEANPDLELDPYKTNEAGERLISDDVWNTISSGLDAEKAYQRRMGFKEFDVRGRKQRESNVPLDIPSAELAKGRRYMTGWAPGYARKEAGAPAVIDQSIMAEAKPKRRTSPMAYFQDGGRIYYAQSGVSYPGAMPLWDPNDTDTSPEAFDAYMQQQGPDPEPQTNIEDMYQTETDYEFEQGQMREFEPGGPDDPMKKDKKGKGIFGMGDPNKSNAQHQNEAKGAITVMKGITGLAGYRDMRKREEDIKRRMSDVFQTHDTAGADRGDYMVNVPGVGSNFRPDEHTRMGYNTKMAQIGIEIPSYENYMSFKDYKALPRAEKKFRQAVADDEARNFGYPENELAWIKQSMVQDRPSLPTRIAKSASNIAADTAFLATHPKYIPTAVRHEILNPGVSDTNPYSRKKWDRSHFKEEGGAYEIDDELELSEAEINNLIAQGYELEYLD